MPLVISAQHTRHVPRMRSSVRDCKAAYDFRQDFHLLCRLVQAAAGTVAEALNQMKDGDLLGQNSVVAAKCIAWAVDDGYTHSIIARGLALRRAQAQLASSSLSDSLPDLGPNMRPPTGRAPQYSHLSLLPAHYTPNWNESSCEEGKCLD